MKEVSVRKLSILGMVLLAASAVTAAVLPEKSSDMRQVNSANDGTLRSQSGAGSPDNDPIISCVPDQTQVWSCNMSTGTITTGSGVVSDDIGVNTNGNTSNSNPLNSVDTTSDVS